MKITYFRKINLVKSPTHYIASTLYKVSENPAVFHRLRVYKTVYLNIPNVNNKFEYLETNKIDL